MRNNFIHVIKFTAIPLYKCSFCTILIFSVVVHNIANFMTIKSSHDYMGGGGDTP